MAKISGLWLHCMDIALRANAKLFISRDQAEEAMAYQVILLCDLDHNVFAI